MKKANFLHGFLGLVIGLLTGFIIRGAQTAIDPAKAGVTLWILLVASIFILLIESVPAIIFLRIYGEWKKSGHINWEAVRSKIWYYVIWLAAGLVLSLGIGWAQAVNLKEIGVPFWIFLFAGLLIILLQLIPAIIIFVGILGVIIHHNKKIGKKD